MVSLLQRRPKLVHLFAPMRDLVVVTVASGPGCGTCGSAQASH